MDAGPVKVVQLTTGYEHTCAVTNHGTVYCWGQREYGYIDDEEQNPPIVRQSPSLTPLQIAGIDDALEVRSTSSTTCALRKTGTVVCWGINEVGQIGDGTRTDRLTPTAVKGVTDAVELTVGSQTACVRRKDASVVCWGNDVRGAESTRGAYVVPDVSGATGIAAGIYHACALLATGDVMCWGQNFSKQLGIGTAAPQTAPVKVTTLSDTYGAPTLITANNHYSCALTKIGGFSYCWGRNDNGSVPFARSTGTQSEFKSLSAGFGHTCGVAGAGEVWCWGRNDRGQWGNNKAALESGKQTAKTAGIIDAVQVAAGGNHTCALRANGDVLCWGANHVGQLGEGTMIDRAVPTKVLGLP